MPTAADRFDEAYYKRFYRNIATRVATPASTRRLVAFVASYIDMMQLPVRRILDLGCGLGWWRDPLLERYPKARYVGVEFSEYLCETHGWTRGSIVDYADERRHDLVVCQGVLQYLNDRDAARAILNLGRLCGGVLYLEALTRRDWEVNCDQRVTDGAVFLRTADAYRRRLRPNFINCGGGVFLARTADAQRFELEQLG